MHLERKPPRWVSSIAPVGRRLPGRNYQSFADAFTPPPDPESTEKAVDAYGILGSAVAPAIPGLLGLAQSGNPYAHLALAGIGAPALPVI